MQYHDIAALPPLFFIIYTAVKDMGFKKTIMGFLLAALVMLLIGTGATAVTGSSKEASDLFNSSWLSTMWTYGYAFMLHTVNEVRAGWKHTLETWRTQNEHMDKVTVHLAETRVADEQVKSQLNYQNGLMQNYIVESGQVQTYNDFVRDLESPTRSLQ